MRINKIKSKNFSIIKDISKSRKRITFIFKNIVNYDMLKQHSGDEEPFH